MRTLSLILVFYFFAVATRAQIMPAKLLKKKKYQYEEIDFEDMMRRYFQKGPASDLEGIYSVSCVITKRNKAFLSNRDRIRIVERKDNYARIAIIKDMPEAKRDFIVMSLSYHEANKYPVMGAMNGLSEGKGLIYNHIEPDGAEISFSMISESPELLEGEYSKMERRKTITYRLSYLKTYPKNPEFVQNH
jgi:hypothetical protein